MDIIRSIQTIQTIRPKHSFLLANQSRCCFLVAIISHCLNHLPQIPYQFMTIFKFVVFTLLMKVVKLITEIRHLLSLTAHQRFVKITQRLLLKFLFSQQVHNQYPTINCPKSLKMTIKSIFSQLQTSINHNTVLINPVDPHLRKKSRNTISNINYLPRICK